MGSRFWSVVRSPRLKVLILLVSIYALRKFVFKKYIPISIIESQLKEGTIQKIVMGNFIMFCAYKKGGYALANMYPKDAGEIFKIAQKGGVE